MGSPKRRKTKLEKIQWTSINFPKGMVAEIRKVYPFFNYKSAADYAHDAVRRKLQHDKLALEVEKRKEKEEW